MLRDWFADPKYARLFHDLNVIELLTRHGISLDGSLAPKDAVSAWTIAGVDAYFSWGGLCC